MKAYLIRLDISFKKSHSLIYLLDLFAAGENVPDSLYGNAEILEDYSVEVRYPGNGIDLNQEDVNEAFQVALKIKGFIKGKIEI